MALILPGTGDYFFEEKKSKFYSHCAPVKTEDDTRRVLDEVRAVQKAASHHVYAYSLSETNTIRFNDAGEPHGTAGMPVLTEFQKTGVIDFMCVVTRYFGGTLLGAGGLARAYTRAAKGAMEAAGPIELIHYKFFKVTCAYKHLETVKYNFDKLGVELLNLSYSDHCEVVVRVREELWDAFLQGGYYEYEEMDDWE